MSGDKRMPSLLALSNSGTLEDGQDTDNPGVKMFLNGLNGLVPVDDTDLKILLPDGTDSIIPRPSHWEYGEWKNIVYHQGGLCPVKWGQGYPYNEYCPIIDTRHTLAGCVAVATAQLMAVHKFPESHNGYNYNWDLMTSSTYQYYWSDASEQIARLLHQLGLRENLNMKYGLNGSGASYSKVPPTLKSFGYSTAEVINYDTYQVIPELKNGYPILVRGVSADGGHMWLVHGLLERTREVKEYLSNGKLSSTYNETHWYVQCNWGWNGYDDGYYLSKVFNTNDGCTYPDGEASSRAYDSGNGYNFDQDIKAIINIRK
ncbi:MAG: C10 family peptidase [Muribaculaceae bacterium]|nr:C10 family peptidase [Muribaculaceae bacterium]